MAYRFERVTDDNARIYAEAELLSCVFPGTQRYSPEYLRWQYFENPDGGVVGFDAFSGAELAAHYVAIPLAAVLFGKPAKGLLSLNTATHPAHQGKGLFVGLADATYQLAQELSYDFVIGVANANSTPGFVRKLAFQLVAPLAAEVGVGRVERLGTNAPHFERTWSSAGCEWRMKSPGSRYFTRGGIVYSATHNAAIRMQMTMNSWSTNGMNAKSRAPLTAWIGLEPSRRWTGAAIPIPKKLRPSPLNLIFRDLSGHDRKLSGDGVALCAADFDAY